MSYTTFELSNFTANKTDISQGDKITFIVDVKNIGCRESAEVIQLYIRDVKSSVPRPLKELKGFEKINLKPSQTESLTIDKDALSFFDAEKHAWIAESGDFEALIGTSSSDIKGRVNFKLK